MPAQQPYDWATYAAYCVLALFVCLWAHIFSRAGYSRWWALSILVPLLNLYMIGKIIMKAGYSMLWVLLLFAPVVNLDMLLVFAFSEWPLDRKFKIKAV